MATPGAENAEVVSTGERDVCTAVDTEHLSWRSLAVVFFLATVIIVSRRPDAIFNPQFWAEDGSGWYAQAYKFGWLRAVLIPEGGYFNLIPRVAAAISLLVPFHSAPLVLNLVGVFCQALPAFFLLSSRCRNWGSLRFRAVLALVYLLLPNSSEIHVTVTDAQWHMAVLMLLILSALPPATVWWRLFDGLCLTLGSLTGPYCLLLLPIAAIYCWRFRDRRRLNVFFGLIILSLIQSAPILCSAQSARTMSNLGATPDRLIRLIGGHVVVGSLWGRNTLAASGSSFWLGIAVLLVSSFVAFCLWRAPLGMKSLLAFAGMVLFSSLKSPYIPGSPAWVVLENIPGCRYWYLPTLAICWCLAWTAARYSRVRLFIVPVLLLGAVRDYRIPPYPDRHFQDEAKVFEHAQAGALIKIPINPSGWYVELVKH